MVKRQSNNLKSSAQSNNSVKKVISKKKIIPELVQQREKPLTQQQKQLKQQAWKAKKNRKSYTQFFGKESKATANKIPKSLLSESVIKPVKSKKNQSSTNEEFSYDLEAGLNFEVKTLHRHLKLDGETMTLPIMVSVNALESTAKSLIEIETSNEDSARVTLDLICVIDNSGSMCGSKIQNVKSTLLSLMELMQPTDRLSLITFNSDAKLLCNLQTITPKNKADIKNVINSIQATDGTDIFLGLKTAFNIIENRASKNQVTSIFLLSDGQDQKAEVMVKQYLKKPEISKESFTIHSFGFGCDHDGKLMNAICELRDGNFYFVENINQVDEFFVDALGGLFSVVAQDITINVSLSSSNALFKKFFKNSIVSKTYGDMWKVVKAREAYQISINQLFSGVSKDYIFEVTVPSSSGVKVLKDLERNVELVNSELIANPVGQQGSKQNKSESCVKNASLMLTLYAMNERIAEDSEANELVEFNYLRVKAAAAMEEAIKYSEKREYQKGQDVLADFLKRIESANPKNKKKLAVIKQDVQECQQSAKPTVFEKVGKHKMLKKKCANFKQTSQAIGSNDLFQNKRQKSMVSTLKKKKAQ